MRNKDSLSFHWYVVALAWMVGSRMRSVNAKELSGVIENMKLNEKLSIKMAKHSN